MAINNISSLAELQAHMQSHANKLQEYLSAAQTNFNNAGEAFNTIVENNKTQNYFEKIAELLYSGNWLWPYHGSMVCTSACMKRISSGSYNHAAMDLVGYDSKAIYPIAAGIVQSAGDINDGYGYSVYIAHKPIKYQGKNINCISRYSHMQHQSYVSLGTLVNTNTQIGVEGNTGASSGSHLDFGIYSPDLGAWINPMELLTNEAPRPTNYQQLTRASIEANGYGPAGLLTSPAAGYENTYFATLVK